MATLHYLVADIMDEFSARCVGKLQLADSTMADSNVLRDSIVLFVKLSRRIVGNVSVRFTRDALFARSNRCRVEHAPMRIVSFLESLRVKSETNVM